LASHAARAAVSRTLRTLLLDRMVTGAQFTLAPPDQEVSGADDARVNLYLKQVIDRERPPEESGASRQGASRDFPASSVVAERYMMTTQSQTENQQDSDINAQTLLGDAMRVFNDFGNQLDHLFITNAVAGPIGDLILDPELAREFERLKIVLHPTTLDDVSKVWSAISGSNFRRSVVYEATVVQIETPVARVRPAPVETRRIFVSVRRRPEITDAYVSPAAPGDPIGETRVRIGDEITIISQGEVADRTYVRLGTLDPIRVPQPVDGRIRIGVPDAQYPPDLDNPLPRPIPPVAQLQPGPLNVQVIAIAEAEGVQGRSGNGHAGFGFAQPALEHMAAPALPECCQCESTGRKCCEPGNGDGNTPVESRREGSRSHYRRRGNSGTCAGLCRSVGYADTNVSPGAGRASDRAHQRFGDTLSRCRAGRRRAQPRCRSHFHAGAVREWRSPRQRP